MFWCNSECPVCKKCFLVKQTKSQKEEPGNPHAHSGYAAEGAGDGHGERLSS